jgi:hypothetical protein
VSGTPGERVGRVRAIRLASVARWPPAAPGAPRPRDRRKGERAGGVLSAMGEATPVLGVLAGLVGVGTTVPYVVDTVRGSTCPHRGTWLIWAVLAVVVCVSQRADGASWSLAMVIVQAVMNGVVFALAVRLGTGGVSAAELALVALAGAGVAGWLVAEDPLVGTASIVAADLLAVGLMLPKTWRDPDSETLSTFAFASVGGAIAAASVGGLELGLLLYPAYYCVVNGAIALVNRRRRASSAGRQPSRPTPSITSRAPAATSSPPDAASARLKPAVPSSRRRPRATSPASASLVPTSSA